MVLTQPRFFVGWLKFRWQFWRNRGALWIGGVSIETPLDVQQGEFQNKILVRFLMKIPRKTVKSAPERPMLWLNVSLFLHFYVNLKWINWKYGQFECQQLTPVSTFSVNLANLCSFSPRKNFRENILQCECKIGLCRALFASANHVV